MKASTFIKSKIYFKRFRIDVNLPKLSIKGPLGVFYYPAPLFVSNITVRPYRGDFGWFSQSASFLKWLQFAQRSVSVGFYIELTLNGVAFKGDYMRYAHALHLDLGYSHHICFLLPEHARVFFEKRKFTLLSPDHVWLTNAAYKLKQLRWPDPYRGKGVIYRNEQIKLKPGKQRQ